MDNYEKLIERISNSAKIEKEEIERKVEAKRAKLSHLVSKEGAAQIIAAELGLNLDEERLKLNELNQGMKRVNVLAKIIKVFPTREFNKNNRAGKVTNLIIADDTSNCRAVLWDTRHIELIEKQKIKEGDVIEISNASLRNGEVHLSSYAELKPSREEIENVKTEAMFSIKKLREVRPGENISARAVIVNAYEPKYFEVNPETGRKITEEERQNKIKPQKRALLSITIDDGTEAMRSVLFGEQINQLGLTNEQIFDVEEFKKIQMSLLGEEKIFSGQIRTNPLNSNPELTIQSIKNISPDELIKELEAKTS